MAQPSYTPCPECFKLRDPRTQQQLKVPLCRKPADTPSCPTCASYGVARPMEMLKREPDGNTGLWTGTYVCTSPRCPQPQLPVVETTEFVCVNCGYAHEVAPRVSPGRVVQGPQGPYRLPPDAPQPQPDNDEILRSLQGAGPG